jgi:hypothetical protein
MKNKFSKWWANYKKRSADKEYHFQIQRAAYWWSKGTDFCVGALEHANSINSRQIYHYSGIVTIIKTGVNWKVSVEVVHREMIAEDLEQKTSSSTPKE